MPWPSWCAASPSRPGCRMCASTSRSATRRRVRAPRRVRRERCALCGWRPARSRADDDASSPIDWVVSGLRAASEGKHSDMGGGWRCKGATDRIFCAQRTAHTAQRQSHGHVGPPHPPAIAPYPDTHAALQGIAWLEFAKEASVKKALKKHNQSFTLDGTASERFITVVTKVRRHCGIKRRCRLKWSLARCGSGLAAKA